ncbi:thioesterase domain-containing protein [Hirsutella rhossiliensis]|uniref:Thioesterase domain-containing protein n=1 Tax=Hirsutella rhossiliensis TaxID=111463 RepID=A0A9P8SNV9_9HYPO|nr:thioesterase domain-containing protein [Hirsutella rhossiliensis]KAH0967536.1 thioesterase domain-containing protein [Hirsutella rhossiliensis]
MDVITLLQGDEASCLTPLFLIHPISGVALPFLRLEPLSDYDERPVYGITSPVHCPGGENFKYPPSLKALAALYLQEIRDVQPEGPYLLGGWSMGGMVAMFMAQMLETMGEEVLKVIMIDSANPEVFPNFSSPEEHREFAKATFERTLSAGGLQPDTPSEPSSPILSPLDYESDVDDYDPMACSGRFSPTWRSASSSNTTVTSSASSIFDQASPLMSDGSLLSPECMSDESDFDFYDDDCDSDFDDAGEPPQVRDFMRQMKLHVHHGLELIAGVEPGQLFVPGQKSNFDAVLVKCTSEPMAVDRRYADHEGVRLIQTVMREKAMRWDPAQFRSFESIPFSGDHDGAFQPQYVGELSAILRECVEDLD